MTQNINSFSNSDFEAGAFKTRQTINARELVSKYIYHWPIFIIGILLAFAAAFFYLRYTPPVYHVKASLLIKDPQNDNGNILKELNLFPDTKVLDNEMEILRSKTLMEQVVKKLNLNIGYQTKGRAFKTNVFVNRPFDIIAVNDEQNGSAIFTLDIINNNVYELEEVATKKRTRGKFNSVMHTPIGDYIFKKTGYFQSHIGRTIYLDFVDTETAVNSIISKLNFTPGKSRASVIDLTLTDEVPERGKMILDTLLDSYRSATIEDKNQSTKNSIKFIKDRLIYISNELNDVEKTEEQFKVAHGPIDLSAQAIDYQNSIKNNDNKLNELNMKIEAADAISNYMSGHSKNEAPVVVGVDDQALVSKVNQLSVLQSQYDKLLETVPASNPLATTLEKQVNKERSVVTSTINEMRSSLSKQRQQVLSENASFESNIRTLPAVERQYVGIKRQQGIKENLYLLLLQKMEAAALTSAITLADSRILQAPYANRTPVSPVRSTAYMLAFVAGLLLPFGYVYSKDALNYRVISNRDITERTGVPILGDVMQGENLGAIVLVDNSRSVIAEQFRALRTNLQYVYGNFTGPRATLFTSSMSGEGKSFIASNIAAALAMTNRKTVILELDLRKPKVSKYLKLKNQVGLSNYLIGQASKEEIVQPSGVHPNFFVISSGPVPPNPAELLEQHSIDELVKWLKTQFQDVIIDTPPIGLVTDALILSRLADASIYVVRHGLTLKSQINAVEELAKQKKFPRLNLIHNGVQIKGRFGYGYASEYGYGYGYSGSYGNYYGTEKKKSIKERLPNGIINFFKRF
jgi:tyrosine-protein kinase Etk/Wzc